MLDDSQILTSAISKCKNKPNGRKALKGSIKEKTSIERAKEILSNYIEMTH
jgi:hypothetical protein